MKNFSRSMVLLTVMAFAASSAWADTPPNIAQPDTHSVETKGKVTLYRVQVQGLEFGRDEEKIDAEVLFKLDSQPDFIYTLRLHNDSPPVNQVLADTLREAYLNNSPVTVYHQIAPGKKNVKIHMVQMGQ